MTFDPPGSIDTLPTAVNRHGETAGWYEYRLGDAIPNAGFIRGPDGTITTVNIHASVGHTTLSGINDKGWTIGYYGTNNGHEAPFLRKPNGKVIALEGAFPEGINNSGTICGVDNSEGFLRAADGTLTLFQAQSGWTEAIAINDAGIVAGNTGTDSSTENGFVRTADGNVTNFDVPGAQHTWVVGINSGGAIAGMYQLGDGTYHGFIRDPSGALTFV